jgi:hypothetical protein
MAWRCLSRPARPSTCLSTERSEAARCMEAGAGSPYRIRDPRAVLSKAGACCVTPCRSDPIFASSGVNRAVSRGHRAHGARPDACRRREFLKFRSKGYLSDTARVRRRALFALDYVTQGTYDSGSNPKWVWNGVEAAPPPYLHFRAPQRETGSPPRARSLHREHRFETVTLGGGECRSRSLCALPAQLSPAPAHRDAASGHGGSSAARAGKCCAHAHRSARLRRGDGCRRG